LLIIIIIRNFKKKIIIIIIDIKDVFQDYMNLVEFLISLGHLPPHIGIA